MIERLFLSVFVAASAGSTASEHVQIRRFLLVVGANDAGPSRTPLRYAASDASHFAAVMEELGGVLPGDRALVLDPDPDQLKRALSTMRSDLLRARGTTKRLELIFYYSGHSDEEGLLLRGGLFRYGDLQQAMEGLPADVRIAILDSCASGSLFTRKKGGVRRPPFLVDESATMHGHAFLTSSSANEAALESDLIGGSFFTHYLLSALRGAGDSSGDGRVTLNEAYQFAFNETLAGTESSGAGAQHAAFEIQLAGSGDLVMTDLRAVSSKLVLPDGVFGRFFVRSLDDHLVAELSKAEGRTIELGIEAGEYTILLERKEKGQKTRRFEARVSLREKDQVVLEERAFSEVPTEAKVARRGPDTEEEADLEAMMHETHTKLTRPSGSAPPGAVENEPRYDDAPFALSLLPMISTNTLYTKPVRNRFAFHLLMDRAARLGGVDFGLGLSWYTEDVNGVQFGLAASVAGLDVSGVQLSVGSNIALRDASGAQLTAGFNYAGRTMEGFQASAGFNMVEGSMRGMQATAGVNYASSVSGVQAALVNISGPGSGAQFGLVNVAGAWNGAQFGLVNVADDADFSFGLFNFVKNGLLELDAYGADTGLANMSLRFGSRRTYTLISASYEPRDTSFWMFGFGFGFRFPFHEDLFVDVDASANTVQHRVRFDTPPALLSRVRVLFGVNLFEHLSIFAGPTFNELEILPSGDPGALAIAPAFAARIDQRRLWPGFVAGAAF